MQWQFNEQGHFLSITQILPRSINLIDPLKTFSKPNHLITKLNKCIFIASMISTPLIYHFMDAKTFYRLIFVGNEPYKNRREELNDLKRWAYQHGQKLQDDDGWNILMLEDLLKPMKYYVRKSISGMFKT